MLVMLKRHVCQQKRDHQILFCPNSFQWSCGAEHADHFERLGMADSDAFLSDVFVTAGAEENPVSCRSCVHVRKCSSNRSQIRLERRSDYFVWLCAHCSSLLRLSTLRRQVQ